MTRKTLSLHIKFIISLALLTIFSWYFMMATHELGHAIGALITGGKEIDVTFPLLGFSRTDVLTNPHPIIERWLGPTLGCLIPLLILLTISFTSLKRHIQLQTSFAYITGFCFIANGTYIGLGWIDRIGDTGDLLRHGSPTWHLIFFGIFTFTIGLYIWHLAIESLRKPNDLSKTTKHIAQPTRA
ncbi:hypothetical protein JD969_14880 [Planctomycetota bacterium]|nr:hypothetical protein JD969_14880 [Planctomycetota bacterium]